MTMGLHSRGLRPRRSSAIRVTGSQPFQLPGIDYAGPLYVRNANKEVTPAYSPAQQYEHVYESPDIRNVWTHSIRTSNGIFNQQMKTLQQT